MRVLCASLFNYTITFEVMKICKNKYFVPIVDNNKKIGILIYLFYIFIRFDYFTYYFSKEY